MIETIWNNIIKHAGEEFKTVSGLPFTYIIRDDHTIITTCIREYVKQKTYSS